MLQRQGKEKPTSATQLTIIKESEGPSQTWAIQQGPSAGLHDRVSALSAVQKERQVLPDGLPVRGLWPGQ